MFNKFLIIFFITSLALPLFLWASNANVGPGQAQTPPTEAAERFKGFQGNFLAFLAWLFPFMLAVATILAVLMLIFAGFRWMAGAISPPEVEEAKKMIWAAVGGLALALVSWLILNTINPDLVKLQLKRPEFKELTPPGESPEERAIRAENE